jgi:hypothetical protein
MLRIPFGWVGFFGRVMREIVKALKVVDLGIPYGFFFNLFDQPLEHADSHPQLLDAKGCKEAGEQVHVDFDILKPFRGILGVFPEFIHMFL